MKKLIIYPFLIVGLSLLSSCVSQKEYSNLKTELDRANEEIGKYGEQIHDYMNKLAACNQEKTKLSADLQNERNSSTFRKEQIENLKEQLSDARQIRDKQLSTVDDLTVLSQSASENIKETLSQLERKDKYIRLLQAAKSRADSINLALAINLKSVLKKGIEDEDVEVKVDKTVVFINLSDRMLFQSGSFQLTDRAHEVLQKIALIIESRPELEVMVEGYTDNVPIHTPCIDDNWDLSVKRSTSVVRVLQEKYKIDPNRLIAAGRGEYNTLDTNDTAEGRAVNRRTRIIILPKLDQFYDLLNPGKIPD